jgi:flagella basal body P-ring formation protein FlgA
MSIISALTVASLISLSHGSLVAKEVIRAGAVLTEENVESEDGFISDEDRALLGREMRRTLYKGAKVKPENTQARRLIIRNQSVMVKYRFNGMEITINGRAMGDGAAGDQISVMNSESKRLVSGSVMPDGWVLVK